MSGRSAREYRLRRAEAYGGTGLILFLAFGDLPRRLLSGMSIDGLREQLGRPTPPFEPKVHRELTAHLATHDKRPPRSRSFVILTEADYAMA